jgi:hypothetical protein
VGLLLYLKIEAVDSQETLVNFNSVCTSSFPRRWYNTPIGTIVRTSDLILGLSNKDGPVNVV